MRTILHADLNSFYASVECLHRPEIRHLPVVVGGDEAARHGIVLAKNGPAKASGIYTGEVLWQARQKCPPLIVIPANFPRYMRFSRLAKNIYLRYTDQVESFGIDEAWLDITGSLHGADPGDFADAIRACMREELGLTVSIGVSWNKIFAKLGSDMKKPDATTIITPNNFHDTVWPLPIEDLLYVGRATAGKLHRRGIHTIGALATADPERLRLLLGKWGLVLHTFANGWDESPVDTWDNAPAIKSIGNSTTTMRDLCDDTDVRIIVTVLAESVARRLRENGFKAQGVGLHLRTNTLSTNTLQMRLNAPTACAADLIQAAMALFHDHYHWQAPLRSLGVRAIDLVPAITRQASFFPNLAQEKAEHLEEALDHIRNRFGAHSIVRSNLMLDPTLSDFDPKSEHVIHPISYFKGGSVT